MIKLTELQKDGIGELLNIGMGNAAESLSQMVGEEVLLSVPDIQLLPTSEVEDQLANAKTEMSAISQKFEGAFKGNALLLFPENKSLELVWALLQGSVPKEEIADLEEDALSEVGNVIINACLGTLSNMLKDSINSDFPQFRRGQYMNIIDDMSSEDSDNPVMLFMHIDFKLKTKDIDGYVAIVMDVGELKEFLTKIDAFIAGI